MKSEKSNLIDINKSDLKKLSKSELIKLLLKQEKKKPEIIVIDDTKPVPAPRTYKPVPAPRTKIELLDKALKGYTKSYKITIKNKPTSTTTKHKRGYCISY